MAHAEKRVLFGDGVEVVLRPGDEPEIAIRSSDGLHSFVVQAHRGPAGLALIVSPAAGTRMRIHGNRSDGAAFPPVGEEMPRMAEVGVCAYDETEYADKFRAWYEGRGEFPGEPADAG